MRFYSAVNNSKRRLVYCKIEDGCFSGAGGPGNLEEILRIFYRWATV
ncbi:Imm53 family immunity protein [Paenibacillus sp. RC84]